ncbi:MCE family protein [Tomitella gaofuii]|uniref:MCE family protein n=1 Tax=Tomitella gaofuii TaxID=2760083 RepID=UPI0015FBD0D6|nr:MCE family protein [Tomitella gaofuii]
MSTRPGARVNYKLFALVLAAVLVGLVAIAVTSFLGGFQSKVHVTLRADRAGLVMEPDAKVKMRGVQVGFVESIEHELGGAVLDLAIYPDQMDLIPANVHADIRSTTVFGAKYVNFEEPADPSAEHLQPGDIIESQNVTVEFNTLFQHLTDVLNTVQPQKINATLGAVATALDGQGEALGETLVGVDDYLEKMNPSLPDLRNVLQKSAPVTDIYAQATPDLMSLLDNTTAVGGTIVDKSDPLAETLAGATSMANTGKAVLDSAGDDFITSADLLQPTVGLTREYSPVLTCFIVGIANAKDAGEAAFGGAQPGLSLTSGLLPGAPSYQYPDNLPKVNAKNPPSCYGLPWLGEGVHAPYVVTDSGVNPTVTEQQRANPQSLWAFLLGPPPPGWTW